MRLCTSVRPIAALIVLLGAWVLLALAWDDRVAHGEDEAPGGGYVGTAVCQTCHTEQHELWTGSSHAHTVEAASVDTLPGDAIDGKRVSHPPGATQFLAEQDKTIAVTVGPDGKPTRYHLSHIVGRMRVRMFLATMADGRVQVLPGMLEAPTGTWFDYTHLIFGAGGTDWDKAPIVKPGDPSFWTGPVRSWGAKCASCHVSGYEPKRPVGGRGPRMTYRALGVHCEMCHGPGAAHVAFHKQGAQGTDPLKPYEDYAHDRAVGVCLQCHMESEVVGRGFRPGDDVFEHRDPTLLIDPERIDPSGRSLELIYDGVPFSVSRCAAEGKLTCISCHDPHGSSNPSQLRKPPEDDALCTRCHEAIAKNPEAHTHHDRNGSGGRCVNCHMPFLSIERGHGVVADHSISTPRYDLKGDRIAQVACTWCHQGGLVAPEGAPHLEEAALKEVHASWYGERAQATGWMAAIGAARLKQPDAHVGLLGIVRDATLPRVVRASAVELLGAYAKQVPLALLAFARDSDSLVRRRAMTALAGLDGKAVNAALQRGLVDRSLAVRVASARASLVGWRRVQKDAALLKAALPVLAQDAADGPGDEMRWFRLGAARSLAGDDAGALEAYVRQVELDPFAGYVKQEIVRLKKALGR